MGFLSRPDCIKCDPPAVPASFIQSKLSVVLDIMSTLENVRTHLTVQDGGRIVATDQYVVSIFVLKEVPAVQWPYIETQLAHFVQLAGLRRPLRATSSGLRVWTSLVALHNYAVCVHNSYPSKCPSQQQRHERILEFVTIDAIADAADSIYTSNYTDAWDKLCVIRELVTRELAEV